MTRYQLLGGQVDAVTPDQVFDFTGNTIATGGKGLVANHNLNSLNLWRKNAKMQAFYAQADLIEIDSMPLIFWGKLLGADVKPEHRSTFTDWWPQFFERTEREGWSIYYLGSAPGVAEQAAVKLRALYPALKIKTRDGYFDATPGSSDNADILADITSYKPNILFVGMGMPRQEEWIIDHYNQLPNCVTYNVGAAFDYVAGIVPTPPRWTGRLGLEWLWRFGAEPKRLFSRYFIDPWSLLPEIFGDVKRRITRGPHQAVAND